MSIQYEIIKSWDRADGNVNSMEEILSWIDGRNRTLKVEIEKVPFPEDGFWYLDRKDGHIKNRNNSFFSIAGYRESEEGRILCEQPVLLQPEIGYLGIICKRIDGVLNFLMQAKIEPGNVNTIQISPTIQATRSNFTRLHGGAAPAYLEYFRNADRYEILVDQLQSEQSSRFYKKRNRNIIILIPDDEEIEVLDSHMWMTLGQLKELMKIDNAVNMDTRTVLSGLRFDRNALEDGEAGEIRELFRDKALYASMFEADASGEIHALFNALNDTKMMHYGTAEIIPLTELSDWEINGREIVCRHPYSYKVIYCDIEIEGREVRRWSQPLFEAVGMMTFGLCTRVNGGRREFLVRIAHEPGCFDVAELGPTVQMEPPLGGRQLSDVEKTFTDLLGSGSGVMRDVVLSEEGGRFYHEENRNVVLDVTGRGLAGDAPKGFMWVSFAALNEMVRFSNVLNIQLRNLLAILDK